MNIFPWTSNKEVAKESLEFLQKKIEIGDFVYPLSLLPYPKSKIRKAILRNAPKFITSSSDPKNEQCLIEKCYVSLSNFMHDDEANTIFIERSSPFEKDLHEKYLLLLSKMRTEESELLNEIEQLYIDHGFREDLNAVVEKFISNPENFLLFRGEGNTNRNGFRFTMDKQWANNFGDTIIEGRLPSNSKVHILKYSDIQYAPQVGFTTESSWFLRFMTENNYDAILATDPMSPSTFEVIVNPKHIGLFKASKIGDCIIPI